MPWQNAHISVPVPFQRPPVTQTGFLLALKVLFFHGLILAFLGRGGVLGLPNESPHEHPCSSPRLRSGQSTAGGPKWTTVDLFRPVAHIAPRIGSGTAKTLVQNQVALTKLFVLTLDHCVQPCLQKVPWPLFIDRSHPSKLERSINLQVSHVKGLISADILVVTGQDSRVTGNLLSEYTALTLLRIFRWTLFGFPYTHLLRDDASHILPSPKMPKDVWHKSVESRSLAFSAKLSSGVASVVDARAFYCVL